MSKYLQELIPSDNVIEVALQRAGASVQTNVMEAVYDWAPTEISEAKSGFVGVFIDEEGQPTWARRAARYLSDEFDDSGGTLLFGDVLSSLADGAGECHANFRHAFDLWDGTGPAPFSQRQNYGSCVDASCGTGECILFGWRAAKPEYGETFRFASGWLKYAERGYCSDGWNGSGCATAAKKVGCGFRRVYDLGGNKIDWTDGSANEKAVARTWCRSGVPDWLKLETLKHGYEDGAITRFQGGVPELRAALAAGGFVHTSGTRTSGGSKPFSIGSVGPHMQSAIGCDDSDQFRQFCRDMLQVTPRTDDFPVIMDQTWGPGWSGETADKYWPSWWGRKPEGAWVWWASDVVKRLSCDYVWLPRVKGFPGEPPVPPPPKLPQFDGTLRVTGSYISGIVIAATAIAEGQRFTSTPNGDGTFKLVPIMV